MAKKSKSKPGGLTGIQVICAQLSLLDRGVSHEEALAFVLALHMQMEIENEDVDAAAMWDNYHEFMQNNIPSRIELVEYLSRLYSLWAGLHLGAEDEDEEEDS